MNPKSSRRNFIKTGALAGIVSALPFNAVFAETYANDYKSGSNEKNLVFLFQGDSITDGNRGRNTDPNHIMGHGYAFSVASRIGADFPDKGLTFYNRGISGNTIKDLQQRWQTDTLDIKPDVLSILAGINDIDRVVNNPDSESGIEEFEVVYRDILEQTRNQNPEILLVIGLPFFFPIGSRKEQGDLWKKETKKKSLTVKKLASEYSAMVVDYPTVFEKAMQKTKPEYWIWDGIHPTIFGHELMAREWIKQVATRLSFLKKYKY